jgi:protein-disulfide isomerase
VNFDRFYINLELNAEGEEVSIDFDMNGPLIQSEDSVLPAKFDFFVEEANINSADQVETQRGAMLRLIDDVLYSFVPEDGEWIAEPIDLITDLGNTEALQAQLDVAALLPYLTSYGDFVMQRGDDVEINGQPMAVYTIDFRLGELFTNVDFVTIFSEGFAAILNDDSLTSDQLALGIGVIAGSVQNQLNEATFRYTLTISPDDRLVYDTEFIFDVTVDPSALGGMLGDLSESGPISALLELDLAMSQHNASFDIQPPVMDDGSQPDTPDDGGAVSSAVNPLDDPRFASLAGIPFTDAGTSTREVQQGDDVAEGVVRGLQPDGIPFIGDPNAPIYVAEFSDFACPHCSRFEEQMDQIIAQAVRNGDVRVAYYPITFVGGEFSVTSAKAALCAGQQGAFWEFHKQLYRLLDEDGSQAFTNARMMALADDMGLDSSAMLTCMESDLPQMALDVTERFRQEQEVNATPTLLVSTDQGETWMRFVGNTANQLFDWMDQQLATP